MQSKVILGVLSSVFTMCLLFALAVPKRLKSGPQPGSTESAGSMQGPPDRSEPLEVAGATAPELVDGVWCPAGYGICMPAPEGWIASRRRSRAYLHRDPSHPLAGNFSLISLPNLYGKGLAQLLEENRTQLETNPQFELHSIALVEVGGAQRIRVDYSGQPKDGVPVRFSGLIWLAGGQQIVLTFTVDAQQWTTLGPQAEGCLASVTIGPRPATNSAPAAPATVTAEAAH
jgi:hypothetical protein